jgi:tetratricopeptide (TPR) repeat protein
MGDGILASFSSSMDAVLCAISIQEAATELDIPLRIGIHQGDVVFEQKDVLGDGVNIAARIQGVAETRGIAISETIYREIRNKEGLELVSLGTKDLKGALAPMDVYTVSCTDRGILDYKIDTGELLKPIGIKRRSIVAGLLIVTLLLIAVISIIKDTGYFKEQDNSVLVLPFDDFTGIDTLDYLVAGMHNELIGNIGRIGGLRVISKTTANAYKDTDKSLTEIGSERNVKTIIEGAISCFGEDSICFIAKVIEVYPQEKQVGVEEFRVSRSQIPSLYNMVTKEFTKAIDLKLTPEDEKFLAESRSVDQEVYDAYLKSFQFIGDASLASLNKAVEYLNIAIEKDPNWAPLYAGLGSAWLTYLHMGYESPSVATPKIYENLNKALELDPDLPNAHGLSAMVAQLMEWDWDKSEKEFLKTLAINPNDAITRIFYAQYLCTMQRTEEALMQGQLAYKLDALNPLMKCWYGAVLMGVGDCETALALAEEVLVSDPEHFMANSAIAEAAFQCGDYDRVFKADIIFIKNILKEDIVKKIEGIFEKKGLAAANKEMMLQLEAFSEKNPIGPVVMAIFYTRSNRLEKAMDWLEKGFEVHDPQMIYITTKIYHFEPLFDHPRFIDIVEKMNLSLP